MLYQVTQVKIYCAEKTRYKRTKIEAESPQKAIEIANEKNPDWFTNKLKHVKLVVHEMKSV